MNVGIVGSRNFRDNNKFKNDLEEFLEEYNLDVNNIISSGCFGTDKMAEQYAIENNISIKTIKPNWKKYGRSACPINNKTIVKEC